MKSIIYVGIISVMVITMATTGFGMSVGIAQTTGNNATTTGNMTGGNMTGGNMTGGNMTEETGNVSGVGGPI